MVLLFGSIYQHFIFFANGHLFYLFFVVKNIYMLRFALLRICNLSRSALDCLTHGKTIILYAFNDSYKIIMYPYRLPSFHLSVVCPTSRFC